ncbi:MAG TPA: ComEC/Rec2 family competence protein [Flavobacterium sp.]|uniref:ComEC/Rec2 family competence protein n=1 Tax=Flavobacterium sp. TaxID=239 RepID=UPI002B623957|nr:ComEC/Rec2 family competence protein [Flavobacterium sp.]HSD15612.1 ComEC/Rec2 family competence protein [Flavobacterium sp.]
MTALIAFGIQFRLSNKHFFQKNHFTVFTCLLSFCIGMLTYSLHYHRGYKNNYSHFVSDVNVVEGVISERLKPNAYAEKYYFKITRLNKKSVFGKILLTVPKKPGATQFHAGDKLHIKGELTPIAKSFNPYQFDYAAYLEKQNVFHQLYLKSGTYIKKGTNHNLDFYVETYRNKLLNSFKIHHFSKNTDHIINALLLGQRQDMDNQMNDNYTNAGVVHILAISGLHIAILYAILLFLLKPLNQFKKGKLLQFIMILTFLWVFALLSGLSASVVRSVVMFSLISFGLYLNKSGNIYNILAVSMLIILLCNPNFLFDVGFQLSYIAVFSIVWLQPFYSSFRISRFKVVNYFADLLTISFVAQIGVLPLSLYYFHQMPLLFFLANIVVIPLSSFVLILGIAVLAFNFTVPDLAILLGKLLGFAIEIMNQYIAWVASFETFVIKDIPFSFSLLLLFYLMLTALVLWLYEKKFSKLILFLSSSFALQILTLVTLWHSKQGSEFIVFNNKKSTLLTEKRNNKIRVYSNDSLPQENKNLKAYNCGNFNQAVEIFPLQNTVFYGNQKILVVDSLGVYSLHQKPDILLLTQSPKINLIRVINTVQPKVIIADATNYKSYVNRWKATCENEKIPFHATAEKGFYKIIGY